MVAGFTETSPKMSFTSLSLAVIFIIMLVMFAFGKLDDVVSVINNAVMHLVPTFPILYRNVSKKHKLAPSNR